MSRFTTAKRAYSPEMTPDSARCLRPRRLVRAWAARARASRPAAGLRAVQAPAARLYGALLLFALACPPLAPGASAQGLPDAPQPVPGSLLDRNRGIAHPPSPGTGPRGDAPRRRASSGSGFYVTNEGHLVSNHHVVDGCSRLARGDGTPLELVALDAKNDLALLKGPPVADAALLRLAPDAMQGEDVLTYGYPLQGVLSSSGQLGAGMVSALAGLRDHAGHLQIDVPVQPGNSGGPLLDRNGQVVGVVVAKLNALRVAQMTGDIPQNINFAVKLAPLKALLDANHVRYTAAGNRSQPLSNREIATLARAFTTPVFCAR